MASVLIVDDDPTVLKLMAAVMKDSGHDVTLCSSSLEAVELAKQRSFDVAVLDYRLADLDGLQALQAIQKLLPGVRGIISSGVISSELARQVAEAGGKTLEKPYRMSVLLNAIAG
jgi:DNA-binding NtrC family response regulator